MLCLSAVCRNVLIITKDAGTPAAPENQLLWVETASNRFQISRVNLEEGRACARVQEWVCRAGGSRNRKSKKKGRKDVNLSRIMTLKGRLH